MAHGFAKLSHGPAAFAAILQALDVPFPHAAAWATILVELVGGLAVLIGAWVWIASIPMVAVLLVAMLTVHLPYGFSSIKLVAVTAAGAQFGPPGYETDLLYIASLAALVLGGTGPLSVDSFIRRRARSKAYRTSVALLAVVVLGLPPAQAAGAPLEAAPSPRIKAVAFDFLVLFNPDSIVGEVERIFPGRGRELTNLWRMRQFEYTWLRTIANRYADFSAVTEDALVYAADAMKLELTAERKQHLLDAYLHLTPWPDAAAALRRLHASGIRVITLANFSPTMLRSNAENAGLTGLFDEMVSTDVNHTYKPDPRAYQLGMDRLKLEKQEILFAAFGGWDAAGAKSFGYPTVWVNRFNQPAEQLGVRPDQTVTGLNALVSLVLRESPAR
jgi:2-haloacid dehalogenase